MSKRNSKPKRITKNMLDPSLINQLRLREEKISYDDLAPDAKQRVDGHPTPDASAYDDSEIRDRVIKLESGHVNAGEIFLKGKDKVDESILDTAMRIAYERANLVPELREKKADKTYVDATFRRKDVQIAEGDFDQVYREKLAKIEKTNAEMFQVCGENASIIKNVAYLRDKAERMEIGKAETSELPHYRLKSDPIRTEDLEPVLRDNILRIPNLEAQAATKANLDYVSQFFRKKSDRIVESDLADDVQMKIQHGVDAFNGAQAVAQGRVDSAKNECRLWAEQTFGLPYDNGRGNLACISPEFTNILTAYYGCSAGQLTFAAACNWLYVNMYKKSAELDAKIAQVQSATSAKDPPT